MDFRHLIVTCLFSKLRLPFDNQKVKENYAIFIIIIQEFLLLKIINGCNSAMIHIWNIMVLWKYLNTEEIRKTY